MSGRAGRGVLGALAGVWAFGVAAAQEPMPVTVVPEPEPRDYGLTVDGAWADFGVVNLTQGKNGFLMGGNIGLGTVIAPWIDFSGGVRYWKADIDRSALADTSKGTVKNLSFHPDLRVHMFQWRWMRPYVMSGLSAQFISADIPSDRSLQDAIGGFRVGLDTGFGISSTGGKVRWHVETRREFVEDVGNWSFAIGLGWWPDVHATRHPVETTQAPARDEVVPAAPPILIPGLTATPAAPDSTRATDPLVRDLMQRNDALRAEMDSLKRSVEEQKAAAEAQKAAAEAQKAAEPPPAPAPDLAISLERMAALSTMSNLVATQDGWRLVMGGEQAFESGSARLTPAAREEIRRLADVLLDFPKVRLLVEGHSDSTGDALLNLTLSEDRAAAVRNELILSGVDPKAIRARGLGSGVPIADNSTAEGRAKNRRVEIRITDPARDNGVGR